MNNRLKTTARTARGRKIARVLSKIATITVCLTAIIVFAFNGRNFNLNSVFAGAWFNNGAVFNSGAGFDSGSKIEVEENGSQASAVNSGTEFNVRAGNSGFTVFQSRSDIFTAATVAFANVTVSESGNIAIIDGVDLRLLNPSGIRWRIRVSADIYLAQTQKEIGFILLPSDKYALAKEITLENYADYDGIKIKTPKYSSKTETEYYFSLVLTDVKDVEKEITALGYVKYETPTGAEKIEITKGVSRAAGRVARKLIEGAGNSAYDGYDEEKKEIINGYAGLTALWKSNELKYGEEEAISGIDKESTEVAVYSTKTLTEIYVNNPRKNSSVTFSASLLTGSKRNAYNVSFAVEGGSVDMISLNVNRSDFELPAGVVKEISAPTDSTGKFTITFEGASSLKIRILFVAA